MISFLKRIFSQPEAAPAPVATPSAASRIVAAPATPAAAAPPPGSLADGDSIQIAIADIAGKLTGKLAPRPGISLSTTFPLPVKTALAQLPSGAVRVRFAQLRAAAPGVFSDDPSLDEVLVELPLAKILPAINPAALPRRTDQVQVDVPDDVTGLFSRREKTSARVQLPKPVPLASAPAAPAPAPVAPPPPAPVVAAPPTPTPAPAPVPAPRPVVPAPPQSPSPVISPIAPSPVASAPIISPIAPAPTAAPIISPIAPAPIISPIAQTPTPAPARVPAPAVSASTAVTAKLSALYEFWPDAVRQEIVQSNLGNATVTLPMDRLESAMKTGRVAFTWGELSQWLDGGAAPGGSSLGQTAVELPLKVIAPLFMAKRVPGAEQKKIVINDSIPNLFAGLTQQPVQATAAPVAAAPAAAIVAPVAAPVLAPDVFGEIFGKPAKRDWSPQEITQHINALPGVLASLIAMSDGFLVAGDLPTPMKSDTVAAFLPQMFGRLAGYATETQLGALNSLTLAAGKSQCSVFKAGTVFLAVISRQGEALPAAQLQRVAAELAERNQ
jgi:predicted regulator of Ras-like GTPase activity (Roadblock/LC7/MglB family)